MDSVTTHKERSQQVTYDALKDGLINGGLTLFPSFGAVWLAMQHSPKFLKSTNWQSRTALVIMPPLFAFALTSELKVAQSVRENIYDNHNQRRSVEWAEQQHAENLKVKTKSFSQIEKDHQITELYRQSVTNSGVRVVPGDQLGVHHRMMNFGQDNPLKILACLGFPAVGLIYYGKSGQNNLQLQQKVMHTRVIGQATVLAVMLTLMGFKEYMDKSGKFITEAEAEQRVDDMKNMRESLLLRLEQDQQNKANLQKELNAAQDADVAKRREHSKKKKHRKENIVAGKGEDCSSNS